MKQQSEQLLTDYADALSSVAAEDAVHAVLNHDLVGLHAILQALVAQPRVALATIHDVEGQLLVQAGERVFAQAYITRSATIALQNSIAGQLTVFIRSGFSGDEAVFWMFCGIATLLCFLAGLSLYESKDRAWTLASYHFKVSSDAKSDSAELIDNVAPFVQGAPPGNDIVNEDSDTLAAINFAQCDLILAATNLKMLRQQISKHKLQGLQSSFRRHLDQVLMLYGGGLVADDAMLDEGLYCIRFSSLDGLAEASFRAACTGYVMRDLSQREEGVCLDVVANIVSVDKDIKLDLKASGLFLQSDMACDTLCAKVILAEKDDDLDESAQPELRIEVVGFEPSVSALLEKQLAQLL